MVNNFEVESLRKSWETAYYYYVTSDLIRCAIDLIVLEASRHDYIVVDTSEKGEKRLTSQKAKRIQRFFNDIDLKSQILDQIGNYALFNNGLFQIKRNSGKQIIDLQTRPWKNIDYKENPSNGNIESFTINHTRGQLIIPYDDCVQVKPFFPDPSDPRFGIPRTTSCMSSLRCHDELFKYIYYLLSTGNQDGLFINFTATSDGDNDIIEEAILELKNQFSDPSTAVQPVMTKDANIQSSSKSRQTPFDNLPEITTKQVSRVFGVPVKYLNDGKSGQLGANQSSDDRDRLSESMLSYELPICKGITDKILHEETGLYDLILLPSNIVTPVSLDHARSVSTAWRDNIITYKEYKTSINYPVDPDNPRNSLHYDELIAKYGPAGDNSTNASSNSDSESNRQRRTS